jgi:hypothetical protein
VRKRPILALKCTFGGKNRLRIYNQLNEKEEFPCLLLLIQISDAFWICFSSLDLTTYIHNESCALSKMGKMNRPERKALLHKPLHGNLRLI